MKHENEQTDHENEAVSEADGWTEDLLTPKQERALEALLTHTKLEDAARAAGISYSSLNRYMKDPAFKRRRLEAANARLSHATLHLSNDSIEALDVLRSEMRNEQSPRRITAARTILDYADRFVGRAYFEA